MAATSNNIRLLQFHGNSIKSSKKKIVYEASGEFLKLSFNYSSSCNPRILLNNKRRSSLLGCASSHSSSTRRVHKVNETKESNGIMMHVPDDDDDDDDEASLTEGNLGSESESDTALVTIFRGRFVDEERFVYRQIFGIRSYEIGPDKTVTIETLMNFLQETAQNHVPSCGISGNDFGATREMSLRNLIWVVTRIQVQVLRCSKWGDEIEVDTWFDTAGKNGMRRDWLIRAHNTKEILARATSTWVIMNKETRRLSKIPEEVRKEVSPFRFNRLAIESEETDCIKVHKLSDETAERVRSGMAPGWNDMDANQHVNNVKYIGWILESVAKEVLQDYNMRSITLEFRRECMYSNLLESMTSPTQRVIDASNADSINRKSDLKYTHLLRLQDDKSELVRARTEWHLKQNK